MQDATAALLVLDCQIATVQCLFTHSNLLSTFCGGGFLTHNAHTFMGGGCRLASLRWVLDDLVLALPGIHVGGEKQEGWGEKSTALKTCQC